MHHVFARRLRAAAAAALLAGGASHAAPEPGAAADAPHDCRCRIPGGELRDLGTVACFELGERSVAMRCEMSTNTPYWRRAEATDACPPPS